jgi:hypothetical protein
MAPTPDPMLEASAQPFADMPDDLPWEEPAQPKKGRKP